MQKTKPTNPRSYYVQWACYYAKRRASLGKQNGWSANCATMIQWNVMMAKLIKPSKIRPLPLP